MSEENKLNDCSKDEHEGCCGGHDKDHEGCCGGHDHDHDHEDGCEEMYYINLPGDNDTEVACPIVEGFEFNSNEYVLVENPDSGETYLFRATEDSEGPIYESPTEEEFTEAVAYYDSLVVGDDQE